MIDSMVKLVVAVSLLTLAAATQNPILTYQFHSRPDLHAPVFNVSVNTHPAPGYLFLTPYAWIPQEKVNFQYGPYIYDNDGELVWSGAAYHPDNSEGAFNFHVCEYKDVPHLCYTRGGHNRSVIHENDIIDETYQTVLTVTNVGLVNENPVKFDNHEFRIVHASAGTTAIEQGDASRRGASPEKDYESEEGKAVAPRPQTAILESLVVVPHNATLWHCDGQPTVQWVKSHLFQEVSLDGTNTVLFEWSAIDHVPVEETNQCPDEEPHITGNGSHWKWPLDYFHLNSVEKDENDDYLISARHTSTIYKLDGRTGEIIWRLGGRESSFWLESEVADEPFSFAYQHDARYDNLMADADGVSKIGITLWNNQNNLLDRAKANSDHSSGYSVLLDMENMKATLKQVWVSPDRQLDRSQGNHQVLPNRNHLVGYGNVPYIAEFNQHQQLVFYGHLGDTYDNFEATNMNSYRYFRFPWVGKPTDKPALFAYAANCHDPIRFYVSWNGATEVRYWAFLAGHSDGIDTQDMVEVAVASRAGFETTSSGGSAAFGSYAYVVAYDKERKPIGTSEVVKVFVPEYEIYDYCTESHCGFGFNYADAPRKSCQSATEPAQALLRPGLHSDMRNGTLKKELDVPIQIQLT